MQLNVVFLLFSAFKLSKNLNRYMKRFRICFAFIYLIENCFRSIVRIIEPNLKRQFLLKINNFPQRLKLRKITMQMNFIKPVIN